MHTCAFQCTKIAPLKHPATSDVTANVSSGKSFSVSELEFRVKHFRDKICTRVH